MRKRISTVFVGLVVIAVGLLFLWRALGYTIDIPTEGWWTLFIIIPCLASIIQHGLRVHNTVGLAFGVLLFLRAQDIIKSNVIFGNFFLAAMFLLIGIGIVFGNRHKSISGNDNSTHGEKWINDSSEALKFNVFFDSRRINSNGKNIKKGEINSVFGAAVLDLRQVELQQDIRFDVNAVFGSVTVLLPDGVGVVVNGTPFLGSIENYTKDAPEEKKIVFYCTAVFGSVELK